MVISELKGITTDKVCIYKEILDPENELNIEYKNLYIGEVYNIPQEFLAKDIISMGAKRKGILDIEIKEDYS